MATKVFDGFEMNVFEWVSTTPWFEDGVRKVVRVERSRWWNEWKQLVCVRTWWLLKHWFDPTARIGICVLRCHFLKWWEGQIETDDRTYNTLMQGWIELKNMDRAMDLFKQMKRDKRVRPDVVTYTSLIGGWARSMGRIDMAEKVWKS